jgi:DNA-directed RNA polymerase subunit alpha
MEQPLTVKCIHTTTDPDGTIYGKFVIEPLARGFGLTLGNALRRVLLSSIKGAALTSVKIHGVNHEYTTVPNVVEDVMDIMLNLKGVVLRMETDEPQVLTLNVSKPGLVTAGDIEVPAQVRIMNPSWPICTLSEGGKLSLDLVAQTGVGYVPAEEHQGERTVDSLLLDSVFMPIRRVAYQVDDTRVGQRTDYDKLVLQLWSNGSIDVATALGTAANLLIEHVLPVASLAGLPSVIAQPLAEDDIVGDDGPQISIEDLDLSVRAFNCLKRANIHNMTELLQKSEADLLAIKNFGKKSSDEVIERLHVFGLNLKPNPEGVIIGADD